MTARKKATTKKRVTTRKPRKPTAIDDPVVLVQRFLGADELGAAIDLEYQLQEQQREATRRAEKLRAQVSQVSEYVADAIKKQGLTESKGVIGRHQLREETLFSVTDWDKLLKFAAKKGNSDLIQQRIGVRAARARAEDGVRVPGIEAVRKLKSVIGKA